MEKQECLGVPWCGFGVGCREVECSGLVWAGVWGRSGAERNAVGWRAVGWNGVELSVLDRSGL